MVCKSLLQNHQRRTRAMPMIEERVVEIEKNQLQHAQMLPGIPAEGQYSATTHCEHFGFCAIQILRPWRIRTCEVSIHCDGFASFIRSRSIFTASSSLVRPSL